MKIYFCIILAVLVFSGCTHYVVNDAGFTRPPKNQKFSYKKRASNLNLSLIDTNAIYYSSNGFYYKNDKAYKQNDKYIRFYSDGRFKLQGTKVSPKVEDVNNPDVGIVGYYIMQGNVVKMQLYTDINAGSIQLEYGYIDESKNLIVMHDNPRVDFNIGYNEKKIRRLIDKSPFSPEIYKKTAINGLTYVAPNW